MKTITLTIVENYIKNETDLWDFYQEPHSQLLIHSHDTLSDEFQILSEMNEVIWKWVVKRLN